MDGLREIENCGISEEFRVFCPTLFLRVMTFYIKFLIHYYLKTRGVCILSSIPAIFIARHPINLILPNLVALIKVIYRLLCPFLG